MLIEQLTLYPNAELAICGHSLGGALATVALAQIVFELGIPVPQNISLYTFGSPRVGDTVRPLICLTTCARAGSSALLASKKAQVTLIPYWHTHAKRDAPTHHAERARIGNSSY